MWNGLTFKDDRFEVRLIKMNALQCRDAGYPQFNLGYRMRFITGGSTATSVHHTVGEARANADRIMGHARGTHTVHGTLIGDQGGST